MIPAVGSLFLSLLVPLAPPQDGSDGGSIYYDWIGFPGDRLRGGRVDVDPANPLHADVGAPLPESASSWVTLMDNGPSSNRIDLVLVGDGYTAAELDAYAADVDRILPVFFFVEPFDAYLPFFNVHRVDVVSNESGVDNDPVLGVTRDTALDMGFFCGGIQRLLCVDVGKALNEAAVAPDVDQVLALGNSSTYGGAGYTFSELATLAADNSSAIQIALHEFGHSLGDLADEYDTGGPTTYTGPEPVEPNVSILDSSSMAASQTKWHLWLDAPGAGTFEGAKYSLFGIYRPTNNSLMRNLGRPFQGINREQLVFSIYEIVRPIDAATPASQCDPDGVYSVQLVQPADHQLAVQWRVDGAVVPGATGEVLDASTLGLGPGSHTLEVEVVDPTPWVRDEALRASLLTETRSWTLERASLLSENPLGTNPASFSVTGSAAGRPALGATLDFHVDVSGTTGHAMSTVIGFESGLTAVLSGGQVLLVDLSDPAGELLGFPLQSGDFTLTGVPVANDPSLCGLEVYAQAVHLFGGLPFALSNRVVLRVGYL